MSSGQIQPLGPREHALLFAYLAREVIEAAGAERGAQVVGEAVWRYGAQRGCRMARRAQAAGRSLDWATYLTYGEWRAPEGVQRTETLATAPDLHRRVYTCPWHQAWRENDLLVYGQHYCLHIDRALAHGYNPELILHVGCTLSDGSPYCDFRFERADLSPTDMAHIAQLRRELEPRVVMPWSYHLGHLYKTMGQALVDQLGVMGELVVSDGLAAFAQHCPQAAGVAVEHLQTDFETPTSASA
jgi:hypothetical protein